VKVAACGVCRTDLHVVDGELPNQKFHYPATKLWAGYLLGAGVEGLKLVSASVSPGSVIPAGSVPMLFWTIGKNLCDHPLFTGFTRNGGFATIGCRDGTLCISRSAKPATMCRSLRLLCAGLIGWRSLVIAGDGKKIGLYGFGAAAHIIAQVSKVAGAISFCVHATGRSVHPSLRTKPRCELAGGSNESHRSNSTLHYFCDRG